MNKVIKIAAITIIAATATASLAYAGGPDKFFSGCDKRESHVLKQLDLTTAQEEKLQKYFSSVAEQRNSMWESRHNLHLKLRKLDPKDSDYKAQVDNLIKQAQEQAAQQIQARAEYKKVLSDTLTAEQVQQLEEEQSEFGWGHRRGFRHH